MADITYDLIKEPKGKLYSQLLDYALEVCSSFLLVVRHLIDLDTAGCRLLDKLKPFLVESYETSEWPGTRLMDMVATVSKCRYDSNSIGNIAKGNAFTLWMGAAKIARRFVFVEIIWQGLADDDCA